MKPGLLKRMTGFSEIPRTRNTGIVVEKEEHIEEMRHHVLGPQRMGNGVPGNGS